MDSFAEKEPRIFIPLRLDKKTNGQQPQEEREEMMDTDPIDPNNSYPINPLSSDEIEVNEVSPVLRTLQSGTRRARSENPLACYGKP